MLSVLLEKETDTSELYGSSISLSSLSLSSSIPMGSHFIILPCASRLDPSIIRGILNITLAIRAKGWHMCGHYPVITSINTIIIVILNPYI